MPERIQESTFINGLKNDEAGGTIGGDEISQKVEGKGMRTAKGNNGGSRLARTGNMGSAHSSILPGLRGLSHSY